MLYTMNDIEIIGTARRKEENDFQPLELCVHLPIRDCSIFQTEPTKS